MYIVPAHFRGIFFKNMARNLQWNINFIENFLWYHYSLVLTFKLSKTYETQYLSNIKFLSISASTKILNFLVLLLLRGPRFLLHFWVIHTAYCTPTYIFSTFFIHFTTNSSFHPLTLQFTQNATVDKTLKICTYTTLRYFQTFLERRVPFLSYIRTSWSNCCCAPRNCASLCCCSDCGWYGSACCCLNSKSGQVRAIVLTQSRHWHCLKYVNITFKKLNIALQISVCWNSDPYHIISYTCIIWYQLYSDVNRKTTYRELNLKLHITDSRILAMLHLTDFRVVNSRILVAIF